MRLGRWHIASHWLVLICGLIVLWFVRYLPPDTSLLIIKRQGVITVCHPLELPPFLSYDRRSEKVSGVEVGVIETLAEELGLRIHWNVQRDWYKSADPANWGIRKGACDVLVGGITSTQESRGFFTLSEPHLALSWAWVGYRVPEKRDEIGFWAPYFGLSQGRFKATDYIDELRVYPYFHNDLEEAIDLLDGQTVALLTDSYSAAWVAQRTGLEVWPIPELPTMSFALGMWKGQVTLWRAVNQALAKHEAGSP